MNDYLSIFLDALKDSLGVFLFAFIIYVIFSFTEGKIAHFLEHHKKASPAIGALSGLIPQCGVSVVASDLYLKNHITMGCLVAVFFACSDEALPILLFPENGDFSKLIYLIPLLLIKLIGGFLVGFLTNLIVRRNVKSESDVTDSHVGCCHHHIEHEEDKLYLHLWHPLLHSLKIFGYVFVVNMLFSLIIYWCGGEEVFQEFLRQNEWLSPLFASIIGLIPNCASSVLITELFLLDGIPFGALVTGLCMNAGLGLVYLLKNKKQLKDVLIVIAILWGSSLIFGYATMLIMMPFK